MTDKAVYYKDDGEPCQLCKEQPGFCHIHSKDVESDDTAFSGEDRANHCSGCGSVITTHSAAFKRQQFNPNKVNVLLVLQCECTEATIPNGVNAVDTEVFPDTWL